MDNCLLIQGVELPEEAEFGIFVDGFVVSSSATAFDRKDGSGKGVLVKHEIALKPGLAVLETYLDPEKHRGLEVDEENRVKCYPCFEDFSRIRLKVLSFDMANDFMRIRKAMKVV